MTTKAKAYYTKRAWIRNQNVPAGTPAPGHLNCPCGNAPESMFSPGPNIRCNCGRTYTWDGYIIDDAPTPATPAWEFIERRKTYRFWKYTDADDQPVYNVTETDEPPTTEAGYYSYAYLLSVKNVTNTPTLNRIFSH